MRTGFDFVTGKLNHPRGRLSDDHPREGPRLTQVNQSAPPPSKEHAAQAGQVTALWPKPMRSVSFERFPFGVVSRTQTEAAHFEKDSPILTQTHFKQKAQRAAQDTPIFPIGISVPWRPFV